MNSPNEMGKSYDQAEKLELMLRLCMHEVSQISLGINCSLQAIFKALEEQAKNDEASEKHYLCRDKIEQSANNISELVKVMSLLQRNIRIGMDLSEIYNEPDDVHIYRDIIFKLKNIYQHELRSKNVGFITPVVTFITDTQLSYKTSKNLLELVLYNIISNAVKFSHRGTNIYVECKQATENTNNRIIMVVDYGVRIDESMNPYELYYRGIESSLSEGTGLGLYVAKKAVDLLGGEIKHRCIMISNYYVPYIIEYINRFSETADKELLTALKRELALLKQHNLYERVVSPHEIQNIPNEEIRSNICIPTFEVSFEVIV